MTERDWRVAKLLRHDAEVSDRLIQQGLRFLGIGPQKHALDVRLGLVARES